MQDHGLSLDQEECVWVLSWGGRHWPDKNSIWWGLSSETDKYHTLPRLPETRQCPLVALSIPCGPPSSWLGLIDQGGSTRLSCLRPHTFIGDAQRAPQWCLLGGRAQRFGPLGPNFWRAQSLQPDCWAFSLILDALSAASPRLIWH